MKIKNHARLLAKLRATDTGYFAARDIGRPINIG